MTETVKRTVKCMIISLAIYNAVLLIIDFILSFLYCNSENIDFISFVVKNILAIIIGFLTGTFGIYSMATSLTRAMDSDDVRYAKSHITFMSIVRIIVFCIILIILIKAPIFGIIPGLLFAISVFGIKISAYMAPMIDKK